jgi:hypothetical protein
MGIPNSEVGYTSATTERGDHEVHKEEQKIKTEISETDTPCLSLAEKIGVNCL